jgi:uncharacterized BrkB/YihY/UPF0761 family membrane protein
LIKKVLFTLLQFVLFLLVYTAGWVLPALLLIPSHITKFADGTRGFEWDGVFLMLALLVVILLIQTLRKRIRSAAPWTALAFALAAIVELVAKQGFRDMPR